MLLQELIDTFEELKKYIFIIDRGTKGKIVIKFNNNHFYHLVGLHKTNVGMFFPKYIKTQDKKYKFMKKNINKFDGIIRNQIKDKDLLELRITTFSKILDLLRNNENSILYSLKEKTSGSLYNGDYGLLKIYDNSLYCLLGLKEENNNDEIINCAPQSWMASNRPNKLTEYKKPIYKSVIYPIPINLYDTINEKTQ